MTQIQADTLYKVNQELYKQITPPKEKEVNKILAQVGAWLSSKFQEEYFMLYCREKDDFTIFHLEGSEYFEAVQELKEVLLSRGTILDIVYSHDFHFYECWIKNGNDVSMYAFFPCGDWVITIE